MRAWRLLYRKRSVAQSVLERFSPFLIRSGMLSESVSVSVSVSENVNVNVNESEIATGTTNGAWCRLK